MATSSLKASPSTRFGAGTLRALQLGMLGAFFTVSYTYRPWRVATAGLNLLRRRQATVLDQLLATKLRQAREGLGARWSLPATRRGPNAPDRRRQDPANAAGAI